MDEQFEDLSEARAFACAKCGGTGYETGKIRTTGDGVSVHESAKPEVRLHRM